MPVALSGAICLYYATHGLRYPKITNSQLLLLQAFRNKESCFWGKENRGVGIFFKGDFWMWPYEFSLIYPIKKEAIFQ